MAEPLYLGIDLGGTKIAAGVVSPQGVLRGLASTSTPAREGVPAVVRAMAGVAREAARAAGVGVKRLAGGGVGAPGPIDSVAGLVVSPPNLPGWQNVALGQLLGRALGLRLALENDANLAGLAEHRFGAGRGCSPLVYLTVSTGIGGALLLDGELVVGARGVAGEVGHLVLLPDGPLCGCGNRGCLEALASGTAVARRAREAVRQSVPSRLTERFASRPSRITAAVVADLAREGDPEARRILADRRRALVFGARPLRSGTPGRGPLRQRAGGGGGGRGAGGARSPLGGHRRRCPGHASDIVPHPFGLAWGMSPPDDTFVEKHRW
jgi:glucokinase